MKVQWAAEHFDQFEKDHSVWRSNNPGHIFRQRKGVPPTEFRGNFRFDPLIPESLPLLIGDGIHNLRSALDHLACELVELTTPATSTLGHSGVQFPILASRPEGKRDQRRFLRMLEKMPPAARREIMRVQPYRDGDEARYHPLWILNQLDIIDKHRQITIIGGRYSLPDSMKPLVIDSSMIWQDGRVYVPFDEGDQIRIVGVDNDFEPDVKGNILFRWDDGPTFVADIDKLAFVFDRIVKDVIPRFERFFQ
jgi:hypothetical protein